MGEMMKFDLGTVLIRAVMDYKHEFIRDNPDDPGKVLRVVLSREAHDVIRQAVLIPVERYGKVDIKDTGNVDSLIGIPVVVDDNVRVMDIRRLG